MEIRKNRPLPEINFGNVERTATHLKDSGDPEKQQTTKQAKDSQELEIRKNHPLPKLGESNKELEIRRNRPRPKIGTSNKKDHLLKIREERLLEIKDIKRNRSLPEINFGNVERTTTYQKDS